ncbi:MoxR family ATPase [Candidatus Dependentiae bacterium]|nr:MoxR family ATPase [Candidatus Dependentiae bacterium]
MNGTIIEQSSHFRLLEKEISKAVVGQQETITFMLLGILCDGHILLEGVPGVAKTTMVKALTKALGLTFKRIQFTPDLLPSDLIGTLIYNQKVQDFETKKGPIFANLILADEINRAPAKVQAALLEAMQEHQVTIGSETFPLDTPFLVFATQNPLEQEGTYRLPEAQVDRFMFKLTINYPTQQEEKEIIRATSSIDSINQIISKEDILEAQRIVHAIHCDEKILDYILSLVFATRNPEALGLADIKKYIEYGVSPRATQALYKASQAYAFLEGRTFVIPDDVKKVALPILAHRLIVTVDAEAEERTSESIIKRILATVPTP